MNKTIVASAILVGLGLAASTMPSAAVPLNGAGVTSPAHANVVQVRAHRRHGRRQGSASRGNAAMPSRGASGQQYGGTTGGPRR